VSPSVVLASVAKTKKFVLLPGMELRSSSLWLSHFIDSVIPQGSFYCCVVSSSLTDTCTHCYECLQSDDLRVAVDLSGSGGRSCRKCRKFKVVPVLY